MVRRLETLSGRSLSYTRNNRLGLHVIYKKHGNAMKQGFHVTSASFFKKNFMFFFFMFSLIISYKKQRL